VKASRRSATPHGAFNQGRPNTDVGAIGRCGGRQDHAPEGCNRILRPRGRHQPIPQAEEFDDASTEILRVQISERRFLRQANTRALKRRRQAFPGSLRKDASAPCWYSVEKKGRHFVGGWLMLYSKACGLVLRGHEPIGMAGRRRKHLSEERANRGLFAPTRCGPFIRVDWARIQRAVSSLNLKKCGSGRAERPHSTRHQKWKGMSHSTPPARPRPPASAGMRFTGAH